MCSIKDITEPSKVYNQALEIFKDNAKNYFDELIKKTNTNEEANKETCKNYYAKLEEVEASKKASNKKGKFKTFLRVLEVLCYILIILIPVGILIHSHIKNKIDNDLKSMNDEIARKEKQAGELKNEAEKQTSLLNASYDWNICATLINKTLPLFNMDQVFEPSRLALLKEKYGFSEHTKNNISSIYVQSGTILGNPFLIERNYSEEMGPFTYTGTLVIHWTTYERGADGHMHTQYHTQTLVATISKPKPFYYLDTWLIYGNEAAPKLEFTRTPSGYANLDDRGLEKAMHKVEKELSKQAKKDLTFTKMANSKFETLFNATDRNNEVEYRLLFTPLAQSNMIDLVRMKEPFGDDFNFVKRQKLNYIKTKHSQDFDYSCNPSLFINFDIEKSRESYVNYTEAYFKSFYFDFAPLLSVPLYQQHKAQEYIYKDNHANRFTSFEVESLANSYDRKLFAHKDSATDAILKSRFVKRSGDYDEMEITAYSFKSIRHVTMVPTMGGDGHMHPVPVVWFEYLPIFKKSPFYVKNVNLNRADYIKKTNINDLKNVYYQKGLVSSLLRNESK